MSLGIGGHQSARMLSEVWLTPPSLIKALGEFDLDPCAPRLRPWAAADTHFCLPTDDGLALPWCGRVWLNPPYGTQTGKWLEKLAEHGNGIALIFARTETSDWLKHIWNRADAIVFLHGRLHFHHLDGTRAEANAGAPSALIAYGQNNVAALRCRTAYPGALVTNWRT